MDNPKSPTIYDVAKRANVSITTVSRVLNTPGQVRMETRARVLVAIDELGFVPRADASARARKSVGRIGVLTPFFTYSSFIQRMRGIATALADSRYELVIYPVDSRQRLENYLATLPITRRLDGLIVMSLCMSELAAERLVNNNLPTILVELTSAYLSSVEIDNQHGGRLAARYLVEKGYTRCAFIGSGDLPDYAIRPEDMRLAGFRAALSEFGLDLPNEYIQYLPLTHLQAKDPIYNLLNLPEPPNAIFAATDDLAIRVLRVAREANVDVPNDLAVIGFDDLDVADLIGLTSVHQPLHKSGQVAADLLMSALEDPSWPLQHIRLQLRIIERETS